MTQKRFLELFSKKVKWEKWVLHFALVIFTQIMTPTFFTKMEMHLSLCAFKSKRTKENDWVQIVRNTQNKLTGENGWKSGKWDVSRWQTEDGESHRPPVCLTEGWVTATGADGQTEAERCGSFPADCLKMSLLWMAKRRKRSITSSLCSQRLEIITGNTFIKDLCYCLNIIRNLSIRCLPRPVCREQTLMSNRTKSDINWEQMNL